MSEPEAWDIAQLANNYEDRTATTYDEILIDSVSIPVSAIQSTDLSRFEGKVTFGDYTAESDQQTSSWIQSTWQGGALIDDQIEGATDSRFRWSNLWTFSPGQLSLNPQLDVRWMRAVTSGESLGITTGRTRILAEWNDKLYVACGRKVSTITGYDQYDPASWTVTIIGNLADESYGEGAIFGNPDEGTVRLWIPVGQGIQTIKADGTISALDTSVPAISLHTWDKRLYALTANGYLRYYTQNGIWDIPDNDRRLPTDQEPMQLEEFFDKSGDSTLFISTDRQMWAYNPPSDMITPTSLRVPGSLKNGRGFRAWRDDSIYYSMDVGVRSYSSGGVMTPMGLDRDDGIPVDEMFDDARGIVGMVGALNFLVVAVDAGVFTNDAAVVMRRRHICAYNQAGWHILATWDYPDGLVADYEVSLFVSDLVGGYRVWFGTADLANPPVGGNVHYALHSVNIPYHDYGPKQIIAREIARFETDGELRTGWFDASMEGFLKLFSHVVVTTENTGGTMDGYIDVSYRLDNAPETWVPLGRVSSFGRTTLPFGIDAKDFPAGLTAYRIELKYTFHSNTNLVSPIIRSVNLKFIKLPLFARAWIVDVPLDREVFSQGLGPLEIDRYLARITTQGPFNHLVIGNRHYRARVAQWQGRESLQSTQKIGRLNLVGLQIPGYPLPGFEEV